MSRLNTIRLDNNIWVDHLICYNSASMIFKQHCSGNILFLIGFNNQSYINNDKYIGAFHLSDNNLWEFYSSDDSFKIATGNKCLIKAEVKVFKELVSRGIILVTSH
jgi:hypothetical protein